MKPSRVKSRRFGVADSFIEQCLALGRVAFPLEGLLKETGLSAIAARFQLLRLGNRVTRVSPRQPFFLIVNPEHRAVGSPPVAWWLNDYFTWLGQPYYLALQSAASAFGSNPQALQVTQVMTKIAHRPLEIGRIRVQFFVKRTVEQTPTQPLANAFAPLQVSTPEATVFDLIRYAPRIGGIGRAADTIAPLLPLIRPIELRRVLKIEDVSATAQRLGFVLEKLRATPLAEVVQEWLPAAPVLVPLIPGLHRDAPNIKRWNILNNAGEIGRL
jgi:AbiEi antitoxin C-terminal domain